MHNSSSKINRYQRLYAQLEELLSKSPTLEAKMATVNAILYHKIKYIFWVGFYFRKENQLNVMSYQGPLACQVLPYQKGVCWECIDSGKTVIVPDVHAHPNHITCDSRSRSEIVLPLHQNDEIIGVLDIDSDLPEAFSEEDKTGLEKILTLL